MTFGIPISLVVLTAIGIAVLVLRALRTDKLAGERRGAGSPFRFLWLGIGAALAIAFLSLVRAAAGNARHRGVDRLGCGMTAGAGHRARRGVDGVCGAGLRERAGQSRHQSVSH